MYTSVIGLRAIVGAFAVMVLSVAIACGGDDEAVAAPAIDAAALAKTIQQAVADQQAIASAELAKSVQLAVQQAVPDQVSAEEIQGMVEAAVTAAAPETASPEDIRKMVEEAVAVAAKPGATKEEMESLVTQAVAASAAAIQPGVTASEVQKLVSDALKAVPTPATVVQVAPLSPGLAVEAARYGGTMTVIGLGSLAGLDAMAVPSGVIQTIGAHMYDQLYTTDGRMQPSPQMVESWETSTDGLTWTMTLRDGLIWHDGTDVTIDDVVASKRRWIDRAFRGGNLTKERLNSIDAVDDRTFAWNFHTPFTLLLEALGTWSIAPIMQERIASITPGAEPVKDDVFPYIGSGPFKFDEWALGDKIQFTAFREYVPRSDASDGLAGARIPYVDLLVWLEVPDAITRVAMLETGAADVLVTGPTDEYPRLRDLQGVVTYVDPVGRQPTIFFNGAKAPFNEPLVRRAVQAAIDAEAIMETYGDPELWMLCPAEFGCGLPWETHQAEEFYNQANIERAKELLAQSSYNGEPIIVISSSDNPTTGPITVVARPALEAMGFNLDFKVLDTASFLQVIRGEGLWDMYGTYRTSNAYDPAYRLALPPWTDPDPRQVVLAQRFLEAPTTQEKKAIVGEMQEVMFDDVGWMTLGMFNSYNAARDYVKGFKPGLSPAFWSVWLQK
jgi:peptide/nickel transport system substrate-binding protein